MIHIFGHKSIPAAFKIQDMTPGRILHQFVFAAIFQHDLLKPREHRRLTASQAAHKIRRRVIKGKKLTQIRIIVGHRLPRF